MFILYSTSHLSFSKLCYLILLIKLYTNARLFKPRLYYSSFEEISLEMARRSTRQESGGIKQEVSWCCNTSERCASRIIIPRVLFARLRKLAAGCTYAILRVSSLSAINTRTGGKRAKWRQYTRIYARGIFFILHPRVVISTSAARDLRNRVLIEASTGKGASRSRSLYLTFAYYVVLRNSLSCPPFARARSLLSIMKLIYLAHSPKYFPTSLA